ncbi:MAG: methylmalonyl Co-A mutase-associated GTPase MeaB [Desulfobacteraceae bacterium]|nr:methylmalonyl Co-A mutase-associated GTPase MeaB [Desulfobacteraceae bacterium]
MLEQHVEYYVEGIRQGNRRTLAKAITLVESRHPGHRETARRFMDAIMPFTGNAVRLGITGVPGAGKSTFIESFGTLLTGHGHKMAVLAVDPSSKRSGGSILADKTRMEKLSVNPCAFIRPSPAGTTLGGVSRMTRETMLICEAAGFDVVIVETVGVGQSETAVAGMVDFFLVLMITGAGDVLQGIKKGIMELADAVAINKADGDNKEKARQTCNELADAMHLLLPASTAWTPAVVTCSGLSLEGLDHIWQLVQEHGRRMRKTGQLQANRRRQAVQWMWELIEEGLKERFSGHSLVEQQLPVYQEKVLQGEIAAATAANNLLFLLDKS